MIIVGITMTDNQFEILMNTIVAVSFIGFIFGICYIMLRSK
jgi:hypothetical protein